MKISIVAAIGKNRELGKDNKLLWNIPSDLKHFKDITNGNPIIMGRKTFESIGRILPNRVNIIISRDKTYNPCHSEPIRLLESERPRSRRPEGSRPRRFDSESQEERSRNKFGMTKCIVVHSLEEAIGVAKKNVILSIAKNLDPSSQKATQDDIRNKSEVFIIGGGQIFEQAMTIVDKLYLTIIARLQTPERSDGGQDQTFEADTFFPDYSMFTKTSESEWKEENGYNYKFQEFKK